MHHASRFVAPLLLAALTLARTRTAHAEPSDLERARALYDEAGELERGGEWAAAQDRLRAALRIRETPHLHYALAWALEHGGRPAEARAEYEIALRLAEHDPSAEEVSRLAPVRVAQLAPKSSNGHVPARVSVGSANPDAPGERRTLPWILVGSGGALALGGVILFIASSSDASARDESLRQWCEATSCSAGTTATRPETTEAAAFRREASDAAARGNAKQLAGGIAGGVGIATIAVGTYLLLANDPKERGRSGKLRLDAAPLPGGAMAGAALSF